jgi:tellurium resistance protein TerD
MAATAISLKKGNRIDLKKEFPALKRARVVLTWRCNETNTGSDFDLDVTAFGLKNNDNGEPKLVGVLMPQAFEPIDFMVFYGHLTSVDGAIHHTGDEQSGFASDDDGETITIDFEKLRTDLVDEISFIVTIYEAPARRQNFGQVPHAAIRIYDDETSTLIAEYLLEEDFSTETAVQFGSIYKRPDGNYGFKAVGAGFNVGLDQFVKTYGGTVA